MWTDALLDKTADKQQSPVKTIQSEIEPDFMNSTATQHHNRLKKSLFSTHMAMASYNTPELSASSVFALTSAELK